MSNAERARGIVEWVRTVRTTNALETAITAALGAAEARGAERMREWAVEECQERVDQYQAKLDAYGPPKNVDVLWPAYVADLEMATELRDAIRALPPEPGKEAT